MAMAMAALFGRRQCWPTLLVPAVLVPAVLVPAVLVPYLVNLQREPAWGDVAELHLNLTGPRQDSSLSWQGGAALGRSFLRGPELDQGRLRIRREGVYSLHIQVTLANCSSPRTTVPLRATLDVSICSPSVSLLRLNLDQRCTASSQRQTPLARGDTLCTHLPLPLLPSRNADETFFGVQWVHP